jgi:beta-glucosidase
VDVANRSDVVVAVLGEATEFSGEAASRSDIGLPESQRVLLDTLSKLRKPLVVVMMSGRPMTISKEVEQSTAFLQAWFSGHEMGSALADVLFGAYNPSGKLTMTFPRNVGQIPIYYNYKRTGRPQAEGQPTQKFRSNYLDVPNSPLFPFGYGLSYTSFSYSPVTLSANSLRPGQTIKASVTISNTGAYEGEEVVQLYVYDPVASVTQPVKKLKGFQKIFLKKGESKEVSFTIGVEELKFYNADLKWVAEPGEFKVYMGPNSATTNEAGFSLK